MYPAVRFRKCSGSHRCLYPLLLHKALIALISMNAKYNDFNTDVQQTIIHCVTTTMETASLRWKISFTEALVYILNVIAVF